MTVEWRAVGRATGTPTSRPHQVGAGQHRLTHGCAVRSAQARPGGKRRAAPGRGQAAQPDAEGGGEGAQSAVGLPVVDGHAVWCGCCEDGGGEGVTGAEGRCARAARPACAAALRLREVSRAAFAAVAVARRASVSASAMSSAAQGVSALSRFHISSAPMSALPMLPLVHARWVTSCRVSSRYGLTVSVQAWRAVARRCHCSGARASGCSATACCSLFSWGMRQGVVSRWLGVPGVLERCAPGVRPGGCRGLLQGRGGVGRGGCTARRGR